MRKKIRVPTYAVPLPAEGLKRRFITHRDEFGDVKKVQVLLNYKSVTSVWRLLQETELGAYALKVGGRVVIWKPGVVAAIRDYDA